jgi:MFS family permease
MIAVLFVSVFLLVLFVGGWFADRWERRDARRRTLRRLDGRRWR